MKTILILQFLIGTYYKLIKKGGGFAKYYNVERITKYEKVTKIMG